MLQPFNKQCSKEVGGSATLWFLCYWQIRLLTTITRYMMLKTCPWKLTKNTRLKACMKASLQSLIRSWKSPCIWWEILISLGRLYDRQNLHFNLSYTNNPIMIYRTMRSFGSIPNDLENNNVICQNKQTISYDVHLRDNNDCIDAIDITGLNRLF